MPNSKLVEVISLQGAGGSCGSGHSRDAWIIWKSQTAPYAYIVVNEQASSFLLQPGTEEET
jgi:hypothetical protein